MQIKPSPLTAIINPPSIQSGMPGDTLELHVVVSNQDHNQSAVIDVSFDEASQTLQQWCNSSRARLALGPQQSSEVTFQFQIPIDALPGTYDYTLVVDAPEHFPEDTPIQYPRQLKVVPKEQTAIRVNDPSFSLKPTTNPSNPAILKPSEPLQVVVTVDNRSNRVDRFRLNCLDLEEGWFTIRYLITGLEGPGLVSGPSGLELNPAAQGQILLQFHPPADALAGNYSPTLRLHSANSPDLVLLDLVYIQIPAIYRLDVELNTILGKVSHRPGQYEVKLANRGNTLRELAISTKSQDEEELCKYQYEPSQVRVLPSRTVAVNLTVKPIRWWRRPLIGAGLDLNFIVELQDKQDLSLPEKFPQGTLVWKPRPWWQFLLLVLVVLGLLGGVAFTVWLLFFKPLVPLKLANFKSDSLNYTQGGEVHLSWEIYNLKQLKELVLTSKGPAPIEPVTYKYSQGTLEQLSNGQRLSSCQEAEKRQVLRCDNVTTGAREPGKYTFEIKAYSHNSDTTFSQTIEVEIKPKPAPEVVSFRVDKNQYTKGDLMRLSWEIHNRDQLSRLKIVGKAEDGTGAELAELDPEQLSKVNTNTSRPLCKPMNQLLSCTNVPVAAPKAGKYTFELQAFSQKANEPPKSKPTETKVEILPKPFKIVTFTLNGSEEPNIVLQDGEPVTLSWKVEGEEINVEISTFGNVDPSGSRTLTANLALPSKIELIVSNEFGHRATKAFSIKVETPPPASSELLPSTPPPTAPNEQGI